MTTIACALYCQLRQLSVDRPSTRCVQHSRFSILNISSTITSVLRGMYASKSSSPNGTHTLMTLSHSFTTYASNSDNRQVGSSISKCHDYRSSPGSSITCFPSPPESSPNSYTEFNPWGLVKLTLGPRPLFIIRYTTTPQICNLYYCVDFAGELLLEDTAHHLIVAEVIRQHGLSLTRSHSPTPMVASRNVTI